MTGMEDVLAAHTAAWTTWGDYPQNSEYYTCYCGEVKWHVNTSTDYYQAHAAHVARTLALAGFGNQSADHLLSRVEVIDGTGRAYVSYPPKGSVYVDRQDDGRTLKVFIKKVSET